jgi:hypothetical protein
MAALARIAPGAGVDVDTGAPRDAAQAARSALFEPDVFANPRYARFGLRTLLSVLICYVFYNGVNWPGIHTIMLTCLVVALGAWVSASSERISQAGIQIMFTAWAGDPSKLPPIFPPRAMPHSAGVKARTRAAILTTRRYP